MRLPGAVGHETTQGQRGKMKEKQEKNIIDWIPLDGTDLAISADRYCYKVAVLKADDKAPKKYRATEITYHATLEQACIELVNRKVKRADVKTLKDIVQAQRDAVAWIKNEVSIEHLYRK